MRHLLPILYAELKRNFLLKTTSPLPSEIKRKNHVLIIGIDTYIDDRIANLEHLVSDCEKLVGLLCKRFTFERTYVKTLCNGAATRKRIR